MVRARIHQGRVEVQDPIPASWEGQSVKLIPLSPEDPVTDLDARIAALHALGPIEYLPGEREAAAQALQALDQLSRAELSRPG
jgi:hypothetical protein